MNKSKKAGAMGLVMLVIVALLLPVTAFAAPATFNGRTDVATYSVKVENLTHTQPFSPPILVTHAPGYSLFRLGTFASDGIQNIAESGNNAVATAEAMASPLTFDVVAESALIFPGEMATAEVQGVPGARFSLAMMLGITNDGFTGISALRLPLNGSVTLDVIAYDAGTEQNNELVGYVGALGGGNMRAPTHQPIADHPGILGIGDMDPALYGWANPVGRVTITRVQ